MAEVLMVPNWFQSDGFEVRVVRIDGAPWAFLADIKRICPHTDIQSVPKKCLMMVHVPSKYADKPFWNVPIINKEGIKYMLPGCDEPGIFRKWYSGVISSLDNIYEVNYIEFPEHKKLLKRKYIGDCATRAISSATGMAYSSVFRELTARQTELSKTGPKFDPDHAEEYRKIAGKTAADGIAYPVLTSYMESLGYHGRNCDDNGNALLLNKKALPEKGTFLVMIDKHMTCVIDGKIRDSFDCSKCGTRQILEIWQK